MVSVPLNIMCSKRWAVPVMPGRSLEEPTCATQPPAMDGSSWRSTSRSFMPLARVFSTTGTFWAKSGETQAAGRRRKRNNFRTRHLPPRPVIVVTRRWLLSVNTNLRQKVSQGCSSATEIDLEVVQFLRFIFNAKAQRREGAKKNGE